MAALERSGVVEMLEGWMPGGGRPAQLGAKGVLLGMLVAIDHGRPAHLAAGHEALSGLSVAEQIDTGALAGDDALQHVTYRQFSHTHQVMVSSFDPSPVPSFKGVDDAGRAGHLAAARRDVDVETMNQRLALCLDALVEASVPERYKGASSSLAVDWTDHETWSRPRARDDPAPANDPDASWGHAKRNAPGAVDHLFFGYYGQVAVMVGEEGGPAVPELVRQIAFAPPAADPAAVMAEALVRRALSGRGLGDVLADCGYSNRDPQTFSLPLRRAGARLVVDLHPADRGQKGAHQGAIAAEGNLYCPATPRSLLHIGPLARGASVEEEAAHDTRCAERARFKLGRISADDDLGAHRVMCPAAMGKVRCPLNAASMALDYSRPEVLSPPEHPPPCCVQKTITVPERVNAKTAQKHDYGTKAHRSSYARRTGSERAFASLADPSVGGMRRGWCRLFGTTKNALMYALCVVVRNVRIVISFERKRADEARRQAMGIGALQRRRRRRRHRDDRSAGDPPAPDDAPSEPG